MVVLVQVWKSSLSVQWKMSDPESSVLEQFVSLTTRESIQHNVPAVKVRLHNLNVTIVKARDFNVHVYILSKTPPTLMCQQST